MSDLDLDQLKQEAESYGIEFAPQIGAAGLKKKIDAYLKDKAAETTQSGEGDNVKSEDAKPTRAELLKEAGKLVRVNITCMNPAKKDWDGEIITAGNSVVGTFRKFVKFNTDEGYHIPYIIYLALKSRKFNTFFNQKTSRGITQRAAKLVNEFAIDVLDPLTPEELEELKKAQAARG